MFHFTLHVEHKIIIIIISMYVYECRGWNNEWKNYEKADNLWAKK